MGKPRVLVVEDSVVLRRLAGEMLRLADFDSAEAADGTEALDRLAAEPFDLVLSDRVMAPMDGLELLRRMRADPALAPLPFVMISGDQSPEAVAASLTAGVDAYVGKPFGREQLIRAVKAALARRRRAAA